MISFELSDDQRMAQAAMQNFADSLLRPAGRKHDDVSRIDKTTLDELWSTGIVQLRNDDGGAPSTLLTTVALEELAVGDVSLALALAAPLAFVRAILEQGSDSQKGALLPLFEGESYRAAAIAVMEGGFQADISLLTTTARADGNGWILDGRKKLVPLAHSCSHFLVVAQVGASQEAFIVEREAPGVQVEKVVPSVGLRALEMADVVFENVRLLPSSRLGEDAGSNVRRIIDAARIGSAAVMTGLSRGIMEYVIPYTKDRVVHGTALARKQSIAFRIADMHVDVNAMRWMVWRAAFELDQGSDGATRSAQLAFIYAAQHTMSIADEGLQAFGGHGYVRAHPIEMWYRNARAISMLEALASV